MAKKYADIRIDLTVEFEDDGDLDLKDQAHEAAMDLLEWPERYGADVTVIGEVRDTETPAQ